MCSGGGAPAEDDRGPALADPRDDPTSWGGQSEANWGTIGDQDAQNVLPTSD